MKRKSLGKKEFSLKEIFDFVVSYLNTKTIAKVASINKEFKEKIYNTTLRLNDSPNTTTYGFMINEFKNMQTSYQNIMADDVMMFHRTPSTYPSRTLGTDTKLFKLEQNFLKTKKQLEQASIVPTKDNNQNEQSYKRRRC